jgi:anti-sigma factor RsiW
MCDYSERLIAWMDGELPEHQGFAIEQHTSACAACQRRVAAYKEASLGFAEYYRAVTNRPAAVKVRPRVPRWVPVIAGAAAAVVLVLALLPRPVNSVPLAPLPIAVGPGIAQVSPPTSVAQVEHRQTNTKRKARSATWVMSEPAIQIAIPADAMFPPGAVPEGVNYVASLSLAADGSVQGIQLQP